MTHATRLDCSSHSPDSLHHSCPLFIGYQLKQELTINCLLWILYCLLPSLPFFSLSTLLLRTSTPHLTCTFYSLLLQRQRQVGNERPASTLLDRETPPHHVHCSLHMLTEKNYLKIYALFKILYLVLNIYIATIMHHD